MHQGLPNSRPAAEELGTNVCPLCLLPCARTYSPAGIDHGDNHNHAPSQHRCSAPFLMPGPSYVILCSSLYKWHPQWHPDHLRTFECRLSSRFDLGSNQRGLVVACTRGLGFSWFVVKLNMHLGTAENRVRREAGTRSRPMTVKWFSFTSMLVWSLDGVRLMGGAEGCRVGDCGRGSGDFSHPCFNTNTPYGQQSTRCKLAGDAAR